MRGKKSRSLSNQNPQWRSQQRPVARLTAAATAAAHTRRVIVTPFLSVCDIPCSLTGEPRELHPDLLIRGGGMLRVASPWSRFKS